MPTPKDLRAVDFLDAEQGSTIMVCSGKGRERKAGARRGRIREREVVEHEEQTEEAEAQGGDAEPVAPPRPFHPQQERHRQHDAQIRCPKRSNRERDGIRGDDEIARHGGGRAAERARDDRDQDARAFAHRPLLSRRFHVCHPAARHRRATTSEVLMGSEQSFASRLRWWREHRGRSQLDLAGRAEISQRHLSFLELGRRVAEPRHGAAPCRGARRAAARAECAAGLGGLCPGLARDGSRRSRARPDSAARSTTCWRSRSHFPRSRSTAAGPC